MGCAHAGTAWYDHTRYTACNLQFFLRGPTFFTCVQRPKTCVHVRIECMVGKTLQSAVNEEKGWCNSKTLGKLFIVTRAGCRSQTLK